MIKDLCYCLSGSHNYKDYSVGYIENKICFMITSTNDLCRNIGSQTIKFEQTGIKM